MQNNINIINIPHPPPTLTTNAQSRKRNSTCKPHSHGRHQPRPIAPLPTPARRSNTYTLEVQAGMCDKSRVGTLLPAARKFEENTATTGAKCPHPPPIPSNAQNTKQQEKRNHSHGRHHPPPSPPMYRTRTYQNKVNKRNTRQNLHSHGRHHPPPIPPHPRTELTYKCKSKLACDMCKKSRVGKNTVKTDAKCDTHWNTLKKRREMESSAFFVQGSPAAVAFFVRNTAKTDAKTLRKINSG